MQLVPSDPDVQTLFLRITNGDIDLQPDFQRGEVWSTSKRQKLIDSILRNWHVPPIHVILDEEEQRVSVLDGQQRLAAIRDFLTGDLVVNGDIEPLDSQIKRLDGLVFHDLPPDVRRRFLQFPMRLFTIRDYSPSEPGELFFRLNQPASLTAAEQRNAFFGAARRQVKDLVRVAEDLQLKENVLGFSNARMSYDDVISRVLFLLDERTLRAKVTSNALADKYRSAAPFDSSSVELLSSALDVLGSVNELSVGRIRLNKATAQSWLTFLAVLGVYAPSGLNVDAIANFISSFESERKSYSNITTYISVGADYEALGAKFAINAIYDYDSRSTSRVADVSSVVIRDLTIWTFFFSYAANRAIDLPPMFGAKSRLRKIVDEKNLDDYSSIEWLAEELDWGGLP